MSKVLRKCKACDNPVKGHQGPYGLNKCKMVPTIGGSKVESEKKDEFTAEQGADVGNKSLENSNIVQVLLKANDPACNLVEETLEDVFDDDIELQLEVNKVSSIIDAFPKCSLGDASLNFDEIESSRVRNRIVSNSDTNVDIRNLIVSNHFVLCHCGNLDGECECPGEVKFNNVLDGRIGISRNVQLDVNIDGDLELYASLDAWTSTEPNTLKLMFECDSVDGTLKIEGKVVIEAKRVVEEVKGRKELSTAVRASFCTSVKSSRQGCKTYVNNFVLFMIDDEFDKYFA